LFSLLRQFFLLIVFRAGPQDLPATNQALYIATGFNALVGFLVAQPVDSGLETTLGPAAKVAVELVLLAAYVGLWVWIREVPSRFIINTDSCIRRQWHGHLDSLAAIGSQSTDGGNRHGPTRHVSVSDSDDNNVEPNGFRQCFFVIR